MEKILKNFYADHSLLYGSGIKKGELFEALRKYGASNKKIFFKGFEITLEEGKRGDVLVKSVRRVDGRDH